MTDSLSNSTLMTSLSTSNNTDIPVTISGYSLMTSEWTTVTDTYTYDVIMTTQSQTHETSAVWGYVCALIAVFSFGSNFVPVKQFETGDGVFFQWIMCSGSMLVGVVVQLIRNQPPFFPLVMTGGVVWTFGNMCVVPIVKTVGLGLGFCIWAMVCLLSGWSTGRFGFFGITSSTPGNQAMNYAGVALCMISAVIFSLVKNEMTPATDEEKPLISEKKGDTSIEYGRDESFTDRLSPAAQRFLGIFLCIFSGLMYGQMFTAATYIQNHSYKFSGASQNGLDYVFSAFCGIYMTSTTFFIMYIIIMRNKPKIYPRVILPGILSGIMWGIGTSCWFVANKVLSIPVAFPIVSAGPPIVASLWGVLLFREIRGTRNLIILFLGFAVSISGAVLCGVSKS